MKEAQKLPVNRCFDREQQIKDALTLAAKRRLANKQIDLLLGQFRGKRIIDLLPVIKLRFPQILTVALERAKRKAYEPGSNDAIFLANFERSLGQHE